MPKTKKSALFDSVSSLESLSSISSKDSSEEEVTDELPRLSKKELRELVKLQEKIKEEQKALKLISECQKKISQKVIKKKKSAKQRNQQKSPEYLLKYLKSENQEDKYVNEAKIYLVGFNQKGNLNLLKSEIKSLIAPFRNMCEYKIKCRVGEPSYVILNVESGQIAEQITKMMKNVKILGYSVNAFMIKDQFKRGEDGKGICYQCQEHGHLGRSCPIRLYKNKNCVQQQYYKDSAEVYNEGDNSKQQINCNIKGQNIKGKQTDRKQAQKSGRVIRDKSRLNKIILDN